MTELIMRSGASIFINFYQVLDRYRMDGEKDFPLAKRLGIPLATIDGWKLGRLPQFEQVVKVADALGVSPGRLMDEAIETRGPAAEQTV